MCETEHESSYFTFPKDFKKQCSCGKENVYYLCTYQECENFGLICPLCMFYKHLEHAKYCIPIQIYKIEKLQTNWITNLKEAKEYLIQKKEKINKMLDSQIKFIEEIENAANIEELMHLDVIPKYSYPPTIQDEHVIKNLTSLDLINIAIHSKSNDLRATIAEMVVELKQNY